MRVKVSESVLLDTDSVSPDSLKAAFSFVVDRMAGRVPVDWNSLEVAIAPANATETSLVLRAVAL